MTLIFRPKSNNNLIMSLRFIFLLISSAFISQAYSSTYCFEQGTSLSDVKRHLSIVLTGSDKVAERGRFLCLDILVSETRKALVLKWLKKKYRVVMPSMNQTSTRPSNIVTKNCRLQVEKVFKGKTENIEASLGLKSNIKNTKTKSGGVSRSSLLLGEGFSGRISVNSTQAFVTCKSVSSSSYSVQVSLNEENSDISTGLYIQRGQKVNIGQVVDNLNNKGKTLDASSGVKLNKSEESLTYDYFLIAQ